MGGRDPTQTIRVLHHRHLERDVQAGVVCGIVAGFDA
jgi:hypothetical protein